MKDIRLGMKMVLGFGLLIVIASVLGAIGVWNMKSVERDSVRLAKEYVPEVALANEVERDSLMTMYEMRGFGLTGERDFLKRGHERLAEMNKHLKAAEDHASKYEDLVRLKENSAKALDRVREYRQLADQTEANVSALDEQRQIMGRSAETYMNNCREFLDDLKAEFKSEQRFRCHERPSRVKTYALRGSMNHDRNRSSLWMKTISRTFDSFVNVHDLVRPPPRMKT